MIGKRTHRGWTILRTDRAYGMLSAGGLAGEIVWYGDEAVRAAGYQPTDDPNEAAPGELTTRADMLYTRHEPDRILRRGQVIR